MTTAVEPKKYCRRYERGVPCKECSSVNRAIEEMMAQRAAPATLEVIVARLALSKTPMTKTTLHYHLSSLLKRGLVEVRNDKYVVVGTQKLDMLVLAALAAPGGRTTEELGGDATLDGLTDGQIQESLDKLELMRLANRGIRINPITPGPGVTEYSLTYVGAIRLEVCLACGKKIEDHGLFVQHRVGEFITSVPGAEEGFEGYANERGVFFHSRCFSLAMQTDHTNKSKTNDVREDSFCDACGLPIDPVALGSMFPTNVEANDIVSHMTFDEWCGLATLRRKPKPELLEKRARPLAWIEIRRILDDDQTALNGLGNIERLLKMSNRGLKSLGRNEQTEQQILGRAKEIWAKASEAVNARKGTRTAVVAQLCGPPSSLLSNQEISWLTSAGTEFKEETKDLFGERGNIEGAVLDGSCGLVVREKSRNYHPWCYEHLRMTAKESGPAPISGDGLVSSTNPNSTKERWLPQ